MLKELFKTMNGTFLTLELVFVWDKPSQLILFLNLN